MRTTKQSSHRPENQMKEPIILTSSPLRRESCLPRRDWDLDDEERGAAAAEEESGASPSADEERGAIDFGSSKISSMAFSSSLEDGPRSLF